jgi:hypothetical protein
MQHCREWSALHISTSGQEESPRLLFLNSKLPVEPHHQCQTPPAPPHWNGRCPSKHWTACNLTHSDLITSRCRQCTGHHSAIGMHACFGIHTAYHPPKQAYKTMPIASINNLPMKLELCQTHLDSILEVGLLSDKGVSHRLLLPAYWVPQH